MLIHDPWFWVASILVACFLGYAVADRAIFRDRWFVARWRDRRRAPQVDRRAFEILRDRHPDGAQQPWTFEELAEAQAQARTELGYDRKGSR